VINLIIHLPSVLSILPSTFDRMIPWHNLSSSPLFQIVNRIGELIDEIKRQVQMY